MTKCPHDPTKADPNGYGSLGQYACPGCECPVIAGQPHLACLEGCPMQDRADQNTRRKAMEYMARYGEDS